MDAAPLPSVSRMFTDTWQLYKSRLGVLLGITGAGGVGSLLCALLAGAGIALGLTVPGPLAGAGWLLGFAGVISLFIIGAWAQAALIEGALAPEACGVMPSLRSSLPKTAGLAWAFSLYLAAVFGGMFFLVLPGMAAGVWLLFAPFIYIDDGVGGLDSLWRSYHYVKGRWWQVAGRLALINVFVAAASGIPGVGFLISLVAAPFSLANASVLYRQLRAARGEEPFPQAGAGAKALLILPMFGLFLPILAGLAVAPRMARMTAVFSKLVDEAGRDPQKAAALMSLLKGEKDPRSAVMALQLMSAMDGGGGAPASATASGSLVSLPLLQAFLEGDMPQRALARKALADQGIDVLALPAVQAKVDSLIAELSAPDGARQGFAAEALGDIGDPRALEALQRAAQGKSPQAAPEIFAAIGKIATARAPSDKAGVP